MLLKSVTILCLIALAQSATIQKRDIPVEVIYEGPGSDENSVKHSDEKLQLSAKELTISNDIKEESDDKPVETIGTVDVPAVKNLDEKVQLSSDELSQALKLAPSEESVKKLEELPKIEQVTRVPYILNVEGMLQQAEDIISNGLKKLKVSFKPEKDQLEPNTEQWEHFEKAVNEYLDEEKVKLQLKQQPAAPPAQPGQPPQNQNFFQNIASGFQTIANNFIQNISGGQNATSPVNQGDEQQGGTNQGPFQGFVTFFQGGVNNIANTISSLGSQGSTTSNTVLGDSGTATTQAPGFISNFVNNVQQFFGQIQGGTQSGGSSGTQGDTGVNATTAAGPQGPVQVIQSIGSAINQFIQGNRPPGTSGDEGTATTETNIIQSIGSAIQNSPLNPFRPPQVQQPGEPVATSQNPIQAGVQNIGNQIQELIPGQSSTEATRQADDQIAVEQNNQVVEKLPETKGENPEEVKEEAAEKEKEVLKEEIIKQEQMEEQIKKEEIKEEMKQEEMKEVLMQEKIKQEEIKEEKKEEILMTAE